MDYAALENPRRVLGEIAMALPVVDLTVFVSCYNEEEYIIDTLKTIESAIGEVGVTYEIIVIDDCSVDRSADLVSEYIAENKRKNVFLKKNKKNSGLAQNYVDGAFLGVGRYYRLICGDNAEPKETMVEVFSQTGKADMIIPYYIIIEGKGAYRMLLSKFYKSLINFISGYRLHYYNGLAVHSRYNVEV